MNCSINKLVQYNKMRNLQLLSVEHSRCLYESKSFEIRFVQYVSLYEFKYIYKKKSTVIDYIWLTNDVMMWALEHWPYRKHETFLAIPSHVYECKMYVLQML